MRRRDFLLWTPAALLACRAPLSAARAWPRPDFRPTATYPEIPALSRGVFAARLEATREATRRAGAAALVATAGCSNFEWLLGTPLHRSERLIALVLPVDGDAALVVPSFEASRILGEVKAGAIRTWEEKEDPFALVASALAGAARGTVLVEPSTEYATALAIGRAAPNATLADGAAVFEGLRARKTSEELERIRRACRITEDVFAAVLAALRPGMRDDDISALVAKEHAARGVDGYALVQIGPQSAVPHGGTLGAVLKEDTNLLLDGGCRFQGYWSDVTWSRWYGGSPSARWRDIYRLVHDAQSAAMARVAPGVEAQEIDRAARGVIERAGHGAHFTHRLGHGMGLDIHEPIYMVEGNTRHLEPGHVFSVEPGIYLPGELGVRLEDDVTCAERGVELLSRRSLAAS